jgi:hypothetical protein
MYVIKTPVLGATTHNVALEKNDWVAGGGAYSYDPNVYYVGAAYSMAGVIFVAQAVHPTTSAHLLGIVARWVISGFAGAVAISPRLFLTPVRPLWTNTVDKGKIPPNSWTFIDQGVAPAPWTTTSIRFDSAFTRSSDGVLTTRYVYNTAVPDTTLNAGGWFAVGFANVAKVVAPGTLVTLEAMEIYQNLGK